MAGESCVIVPGAGVSYVLVLINCSFGFWEHSVVLDPFREFCEDEGTETLGHAMFNPVYVVAMQVTTPLSVTIKLAMVVHIPTTDKTCLDASPPAHSGPVPPAPPRRRTPSSGRNVSDVIVPTTCPCWTLGALSCARSSS